MASEPKVISGFNGLFRRGHKDACPPDHLYEAKNVVFPGPSQVQTREGIIPLVSNWPGRTIVSYFPYVIATPGLGELTGFLVMDSAGSLWDNGNNFILNFPGADDFAAINIFGRTYFCAKKYGRSLPNAYIYYYTGVLAETTLAAGAAPPTAVTLAQVGVGTVPIGTHQFAISFQSRTGYLSPPSPLASINSTGVNRVEITNIPFNPGAPSPTVNRILLASRANSTELFFVPGGTIPGNVFGSTFNYDVSDLALIESADYLNDVLTILPAVSAFKFYKGRMVYIGRMDGLDRLWLSDQNSPETVNQINNGIVLPSDYYVSGANSGAVLRDILYVTKPGGTIAIQDNGDVPGTWPVTVIDAALGGYETGISTISVSGSDIGDSSLVCTEKGLFNFKGIYPDTPLTFKIEDIWKGINSNYFYQVRIGHDFRLKRVYIVAPLDGDTAAHHLLMMDYSEGLEPAKVKWSLWNLDNLPNLYKASVIMKASLFGTGTQTQLALAAGGNCIYTIDPVNHLDPGPTDIRSFITTGPIAYALGMQSVHTMLRLRIDGRKRLFITLYNEDLTVSKVLNPFNLSSYTGQDLDRLCNFTNEKVIIQLGNDLTDLSAGDHYFWLNRIDLFAKGMWPFRPALTQSF